MKYRTRAKSFNDCNVDWLKDKKEEFARYGFLYQGRTISDFVLFSLLCHIHTIQKKNHKNHLQLQEWILKQPAFIVDSLRTTGQKRTTFLQPTFSQRNRVHMSSI